MRRFTPIALPLLALATACSHPRTAARSPAPGAAVPEPAAASSFAALPVATTPRDALPLSILRLVSEQNSEMKDVAGLTAPVGDARGRARAAAEVTALADELRSIETALREGTVESDRLDELVVKLQRLQTRIALLHEALRVASGPPTAVQVD